MYSVRYVQLFGTSPYLHLSRSTNPFDGKFAPLKTLMKCLKPQVYSRVTKFNGGSNFETFHHYFRKVYNLGCNYTLWSTLGLSALLGYTKLSPHISYSSDGFDGLLDDHHLGLFSDSNSEDRRSLFMSLRKLVVPLLLVITVLMNWGHPMIITAKVTLILLTTKPSPLSVYVLVEQLRHQAVHQQPFVYKFKSLYAKKVEVADYLFLSLAKVELKDQEFILVGILGSWWSFPLSSWQEASSILKCKVLKSLS
ncbi:uncharacterized protein LOC132036138 isoform X1 [Lycium ferocissimum]|uniref:uncharacterized protein LOC132036138 isoform X1 n=1 Tax=Lycium ferocissimum TaxID=112874 RepID=UPI002814CC80|nr:uncharacterized protein LOC132036138 isoform X1 [Lycium ferocissimum]XP_059282363.1 uncharacterized protein LOC132036138 isoform X1 [Lycium ferocissimum]XP_059282364.1 uncharacterized protein LOC132036138 isoform X1 [Lycium ferocissimum]XP_059282365.1 uncharacterized protein LOC132036138 isoform X1 [Lycium ferocissimum]XP_059282366.1 uncharacterized protein LOC132036138 isoform X1 [Lycium ferocissimum]